jgi:uncharacterized protein (TIGR03437 family)
MCQLSLYQWNALGLMALSLLLALAAPRSVFGQSVPRILTNGIVNAAGAPLPPAPVAPGSIISIYGSNFNSSSGTHAGAISATPPLPTNVGPTQVLINSRFAPLYYVDSTQINAQVPWEVAGASYLTVQVIVNGLPSNLSTVALAQNAPGILAITHNLDGSLVTPSQPAVPGEYLTIYAAGLGAVANPPATGAAALAKPLSNTLAKPALTTGGVAADVNFSGLTPGFAGLYQVDAQVPPGIPNGDDVSVVLSVGGALSNTIVTSAQFGMPSGVQVSISPTSVSLLTGATQQFTAAVLGSTDSSVSWSVNGIPGGNSTVGTISSTGLYIAPASAPNGSVVFVAASNAADATVAGTATVAVRAPGLVASPLGHYRSNGPGLWTQFEDRGATGGYYPGQTLQHWNDFEPAIQSTVAQEVSLQLDKMKAMGVRAITFAVRTSKATDQPGAPFVPPDCPEPPVLGLNWPQPTSDELTNLKALFDLVQSKGMRIRFGLINMHMEEQPPTNSATWLGAVLAAIGGHPALDVITMDGDTFLVDTAQGTNTGCGIPAEPPLWLGPTEPVSQYIQWALRYAQSLGVSTEKLSAEEIVGSYLLESEPGNPFSTDGHLWNPVRSMKAVFDAIGFPDDHRSYAFSWYEATKCYGAGNLPCEDAGPNEWAELTLQNEFAIIGAGGSARVVATEMGINPPTPTWKTEWALESLIALMEKYRVEGGSFWRWANFTNAEDTDPTLADPVTKRGMTFVYNAVEKEVLDWGGFHLTAIPNGSFEDDLDSNGIPTHWAAAGKGSASAYYLPQESGQPQVPSRGNYCLRLTASDSTAPISAMSDHIAVTPGTSYTTAANMRFAWTGDPNPLGSPSARPQVLVTIRYLNASGQPASVPSTVFQYFQENSTQGFQTFVFQFTTPSDARSVQIEVGAAKNGVPAPITVDVDNLR